MRWGNGQKYEGEWLENTYHGIGIWTHPDGKSQKGEFNRGQRIRWFNDDQFALQAGRVLQ